MSISTKFNLNEGAAKAVVSLVQPVVKAMLDVFSPATEGLGIVGDTLRVHRDRAALRCLARTKQIASETGLQLTTPPPKFIAQYLEYCSLEDEKDETLIEWWARLLVDAGIEYDSNHIFFSNVLKQITAVELELLEVLVRNAKGNEKLEHAAEAEFTHDFEFPFVKFDLPDKFSITQVRKISREVRNEIERPGVLVLDIFVDDEKSRQYEEFHPDYTDEEIPNWQILNALQLLKLQNIAYTSGKLNYRIRIAVLTNLGSNFYFACHDKDFGKKLSGKTRFKRQHMKPLPAYRNR